MNKEETPHLQSVKILDRIRMDLSPPVWCLGGLIFAYGLFEIFGSPDDQGTIEGLYGLSSWFILSWWLWHDARVCKLPLPMSWGFFFVFLVPIVGPFYIFYTRRWWGLVTLAIYLLLLVFIQILLHLLWMFFRT